MINSFSYMFKDNMFKQKLLGIFCAILIANLLTNIGGYYAPADKNVLPPIQYYVLTILGFFAAFIPAGYGVSCIQAICEQKDNIVLPMLNLKNNFIKGGKLVVSIILLSLSFALIAVLLGILGGAAIFKSSSVFALVMVALILFGIILILFFSPALWVLFAKKESFAGYFRFHSAINLINNDVKTYFKAFLFFILIGIAVAIVCGLFTFLFALTGKLTSIILSTILSSIINAYLVYVYAYLAVKAVNVECIE